MTLFFSSLQEHMFYLIIKKEGVVALDVFEKLKILSDAAKYDASCTSSGVNRKAGRGQIGSAAACGICHSFSGDGRCISLLKVLMTNACIYNCQYCINRRTNDTLRATFTPRELADLTIQFYRRNYIEGLFLSSGIIKSPDYTCERLIETLKILRSEYRFSGYIHAKAIPGADEALLAELGLLADRVSVNIEMPSQASLALMAPDKTKQSILKPMGYIAGRLNEHKRELVKYRHVPQFVPAGQSTQMVIGATKDTDWKIVQLTENLYKSYQLKRVYFSAYRAVNDNGLLPTVERQPSLWREHRLYQADWLLRFYGFSAKELLTVEQPNFNPYLDPKSHWALQHFDHFPVDINRASIDDLIRVPGIGVVSAKRIIIARKTTAITFEGLKKLGVVLKRAKYFISYKGKKAEEVKISPQLMMKSLVSTKVLQQYRQQFPLQGDRVQLSLFESLPVLPSGFEGAGLL